MIDTGIGFAPAACARVIQRERLVPRRRHRSRTELVWQRLFGNGWFLAQRISLCTYESHALTTATARQASTPSTSSRRRRPSPRSLLYKFNTAR